MATAILLAAGLCLAIALLLAMFIAVANEEDDDLCLKSS